MNERAGSTKTSAPVPITVGVVEDQREIREGLAALIGGTPGYRCTAAFPSMEEALAGLARHPPHVALVDLGLPGMSGLEGIRALKSRFPDLLVLVLTVYDDDERIFEAMCAGAWVPQEDAAGASTGEHQGSRGRWGADVAGVARRVIGLFREITPPAHAEYHLTPHETRLLRLLVDGHNYKTAAAELHVSVNTVSFHMRRVYEKLQVHSSPKRCRRRAAGPDSIRPASTSPSVNRVSCIPTCVCGDGTVLRS
jgi:DNA-binding NarL/FixJ family response regulator